MIVTVLALSSLFFSSAAMFIAYRLLSRQRLSARDETLFGTNHASGNFEANGNLLEIIARLSADAMCAQAFMLQLLTEMANAKKDPQAWIRNFAKGWTDKVNGSESRAPAGSPLYEFTRAQVDVISQGASKSLELN